MILERISFQAFQTPIVLVAHSMESLVAKQAPLLAKRDVTYAPIASRIRAIYFLATPHCDANDAEFLRKINIHWTFGKEGFHQGVTIRKLPSTE